MSILSICLSFVTFLSFANPANSSNASEINGFPINTSPNGQGNVTFLKDSMFIETHNASQPRAIVFLCSDNFSWSFSMMALNTSGLTHPLAFSINWGSGEFLVWADSTSGWFYNYRVGKEWVSFGTRFNDSNGAPKGMSMSLIQQYDVKLNLKKLNGTVSLNLSIISGSSENLSRDILIPVFPAFSSSLLYMEAWSSENSSVNSVFYNNHLVTYNLDQFKKSDPLNFFFLLTISILFIVIVFVAFLEKFKHRSSTLMPDLKYDAKIQLLCIKGILQKCTSFVCRYRLFVVILISFGLFEIFLAGATSGHSFDVHTEYSWLYVIESKGVLSIFPICDVLPPFMGLRPVYTYPPMISYVLFLIQYIIPNSQNLISNIVMRLPAIIAELFLGLAVFIVVKKVNYFLALVASFFSLLNFMDSAVWGQYDSILALFIVLAVLLVSTKRIKFGWFFAALAVITKQTALVFLPAFFLLSFQQRRIVDLVYGLLIFVGIIFLFWTPFLFAGFSPSYIMGIMGLSPGRVGLDPTSFSGRTSVWAFNIWPLVTSLLNHTSLTLGIIGGVSDVTPNQFFGLSYFELGLILFALVYLLISMRIWEETDVQKQLLNFGLLMFAFFLIPTRIHERYLYFALAFLPFAFSKHKTLLFSYILLLITFSLNLFYGLIDGPWRTSSGIFDPYINLIFSDFGIIATITINVLVFLWLMFQNFRGNRIIGRIKILYKKLFERTKGMR